MQRKTRSRFLVWVFDNSLLAPAFVSTKIVDDFRVKIARLGFDSWRFDWQ